MKIRLVWEHNGCDSLIYSSDFVGAFARGKSREEALQKMPSEILSYCAWLGYTPPETLDFEIVQEHSCDLGIKDADSEVLFDAEKEPLTLEEYKALKTLALKSASDFEALYNSIPQKAASCMPKRKTFYGDVPTTADEMYEHTKSVNEYYFAEIGVDADNGGGILDCRKRGFEALEAKDGFLKNEIFEGSYGESWTLRKVLRRFVWHDRIHAKAMLKMANKLFGNDKISNTFKF